MNPFQNLSDQAAAKWAARNFQAPYVVILPFDPSVPGEDMLIEEITEWAKSWERVGRSSRTIRAHKGEVVFEFESDLDAVWCKLRYG